MRPALDCFPLVTPLKLKFKIPIKKIPAGSIAWRDLIPASKG
jgi:hypothetical protein